MCSSDLGDIRDNVYDLQQFVAGNIMEEKMLKQAYYLKDYIRDKEYIDNKVLDDFLKESGMDVVYITDPSGVVEYTNEKAGMGLNLYEADSTFLALKNGQKEYIATPIKTRVEDGKPFKFLIVADEGKKLYQVGLSLDSMLESL